MTGSLCIGVPLDWNCAKREVNCSVPEFYSSLLPKVKHQLSSKLQCRPFPSPHVACGKHVQISPDTDASPKLDDKRMKFVQIIVGAALCMGGLIDNTILVATNELGINQTKSTKKLFHHVHGLLTT